MLTGRNRVDGFRNFNSLRMLVSVSTLAQSRPLPNFFNRCNQVIDWSSGSCHKHLAHSAISPAQMGANDGAPIFLSHILLNHDTEISKLESWTQNPVQSPRSCPFLSPHKTV